jgi:carbon storage regulator
MLVLSRKVGERIILGDDVVVTVLSMEGHRIRLGFEAPPNVSIRREELPPQQFKKRPGHLAGDRGGGG